MISLTFSTVWGSTKSEGTTIRTGYSSQGPALFDRCLKPDLIAPGNVVWGAASANAADATGGVPLTIDGQQ